MNQKILLGFVIALFSLSIFVSALPAGPKTLEVVGDSRWPTWDSLNITAIAGNVSELNFNSSTITRTYQGYFGNITGLIVLGDSQNNTLYDWSIASPQGEVYAVRSVTVPAWGYVTCAAQWELQEEDLALGVNETIDEDSVNRTFVVGGAQDQIDRFGSSELVHPQFYVANQSVAANDCPLAVMYNSSSMPSPYFKQVLLSDNTNTNASDTGFVIYTAIIAHTLNPFAESDGFDQRTHDFEMLVGEDGHGAQDGATATTSTYWFYLELD
ncbi:MAG: hypothetical protein ACP5N1_04085 [Candidatus Woesearchaeota archaeon]